VEEKIITPRLTLKLTKKEPPPPPPASHAPTNSRSSSSEHKRSQEKASVPKTIVSSSSSSSLSRDRKESPGLADHAPSTKEKEKPVYVKMANPKGALVHVSLLERGDPMNSLSAVEGELMNASLNRSYFVC
jgi:hypothetical protein